MLRTCTNRSALCQKIYITQAKPRLFSFRLKSCYKTTEDIKMMMNYKVWSECAVLINMLSVIVVMDKEDMLITFEEHIRNLEKVHC